MTEPLIDVVIPVRDNLPWLRMCLEALRAFTEHPTRIWVVNNASQKGETQNYLSSAYDGRTIYDDFAIGEGGSCRVDVVHRSVNDSFAASVNAGVALGRAKNVVILNSDAIVQEGWDRAVLTDLAHQDVGITGLRTNNASGPQAQPNAWATHAGPSLVEAIQGRQTDTVTAPLLIFFAVALRREVWEKVGPLDEKTFNTWGGNEDLDYSWRVIDAGYRLVISAGYAIHGCSKTYEALKLTPQKAEMERMAQEKLIRKHGEQRCRRGTRDSTPTVAIATFHRGEQTHTKWAKSYASALYKLLTIGWAPYRLEWTRSTIHIARESTVSTVLELAEKSLQAGGVFADYLVMLDDDHTFTEDAIARLVLSNKPIVGALAYRRLVNQDDPTRADHSACVFRWASLPDGTPGVVGVEGLEKTGLQKVDAIGMGMIAIKLDVLRDMREKAKAKGDPRLFRFDVYGEDIGFCRFAHDCGHEVWCDTDLVIGHLGDPVNVDHEYAKRWREQVKAAGGVRREAPSR